MGPGLARNIRPDRLVCSCPRWVSLSRGFLMNPQEKIRLLQIELARVRQEATALRKRLGEDGRHPRRIEKAHEDALLLAALHLAGVMPSRRLAASLGIPQQRWEHALALLRLARIVTRQRHWATTDIGMIETRLETARQRALSDPEVFFLRHSRRRRWWRKAEK